MLKKIIHLMRLEWATQGLINIGIIFSAFTVTLYGVWTLNRGFEITDEAYYLSLAIHASSQKFYISAQHWITTYLWIISGNLVFFRASGLILLIGTSTLLALGVLSVCKHWKIIDGNVQSKLVVISASITSALLYTFTINFSPCYNLLASAGAYAAAGLVLVATQRVNIALKYALYLVSGFFIGAELLSKASAGISTFAILILWLIVFEKSLFQKIFSGFAIASGVFIFASVLLFSNTTISDADRSIEQGIQLFRIVQVETIVDRLARYTTQFFHHMMITLLTFSLPFLMLYLYKKFGDTIFAKMSLILVIATLIFGGYLQGGWNDGGSFTPPFALVALMIMVLSFSTKLWVKKTKLTFLFVGLILLPYSVAMGTGNTLFTQVIISLAPWGVLTGVIVVAKYPVSFRNKPAALAGLLLIATVSFQIITSGFRPYHMSSPLINQNKDFEISYLGNLKVDLLTHKFLTDLQVASKNCNISPETPFLGLYNIPGVALALGVIPVSTPWLNNIEQADFVLSRIHPDQLQTVVVALNMGNSEILPPLPPQIKAFPTGYRFCGVATYPFDNQKIQIWKSQAGV